MADSDVTTRVQVVLDKWKKDQHPIMLLEVQELVSDIEQALIGPKPLPSLADHNTKKESAYRRAFTAPRYDVPNGIACNHCGHELLDDDRSMSIQAGFNPATTSVHCSNCGFRGRRAV